MSRALKENHCVKLYPLHMKLKTRAKYLSCSPRKYLRIAEGRALIPIVLNVNLLHIWVPFAHEMRNEALQELAEKSKSVKNHLTEWRKEDPL